MSILDLYQDFGIQFQTEDHKHCRPGWANLECPFCEGNPGLHLGCHINSGHFYCWRCGYKPTSKVITKLLNVEEGRAKDLIRQYKITRPSSSSISSATQDHKIQFHPHKLPSHTGPLERQHQLYLERRGFDPDYLEKEWGLLGTGPISYLDDIDYRHRIMVPIFWGEEQVSFQTRDITGKSEVKYIACPKNREKIHHKHILYGKNWDREVGICVEGVTDVWRLGPMAFAVFGIEYTYRQIRIIAKQFKRVIVLFDDDPQAIKQGTQLVSELSFRGVNAHQEIIKGDPGDLSQEEADYLVKQIIGGKENDLERV